MTVPRLVIKCSHDAAQRAALKTGRCWRGRQAPRDCQRGPLLTGCSQTVRIHLDVAAHVGGKYAGQVHTGGRICTWWDGLVGFKSPASRPQRSPMTWAWLGLRHSEIRECTGPRGVAVHWAAPSGRSARSCPARCGGDLGAYCGWAQYVGCSPKLVLSHDLFCSESLRSFCGCVNSDRPGRAAKRSERGRARSFGRRGLSTAGPPNSPP
jgi:hypothetical protein